MASMARSVDCLIQNILDTVQVHLIGAEPIVQVKKWNIKKDHSYRSLTKNKHTADRARPATATRNPPARLPGARAKKQQHKPTETSNTDPGTP